MPLSMNPYTPKMLTLSWRNVSLQIQRKKNNNSWKFLGETQMESHYILNEVYGIVKMGTLTAIMGPSGAGKTSLLATISLRMKGKFSGEVMLNGKTIETKVMSYISGFVPQHDLTVESLTVQEHMEFMARMKMDRRYNSTFRKQKIDTLLLELGLIKCRSTKLSHLSWGETKRVSLAVQLLTEPKILFCDEPTTGLDSYAAITVTRILKDVSARGCIVICSIHQPASGLLDLFDEIILLSNGSVAFQGSISEASKFFTRLGMHCPDTYNSAEFFIQQLSVNRENQTDNQKRVKGICSEFERSTYGYQIQQMINESHLMPSKIDAPHAIFSVPFLQINEFQKVRTFTQFRWLIWRNYLDNRRGLLMAFARFCLYMFISLLLSTPYINIAKNIDQKGIQNIQGLLYLVIAETAFTFNYAVFYTFPSVLPILLREFANHLYNPAPYYISKILISIPGTIIQPSIYAGVIYILVGFNKNNCNFFLFTTPVILVACSASATGYLMSAIFESVDTASLISVPIDFLTLIFSGLFLQLTNLPVYIGWMKYISQFYYGVEAISLTQWQGIKHINCSLNSNEPCISTGMMILEKYGYDPNHYFLDCFGLIIIFFVCHIISYLAIKRKSLRKPVY